MASQGKVQHECGHCKKSATLRCAGCNAKWYCSKDHQISDWKKIHKKECKRIDKPKVEMLSF